MPYNLRITSDIDLERALDRAFLNLERKVERPMELIGDTVEQWFFDTSADQFASGGAKGASGPWAELARSTQEQKGFMGSFPLVRTGALKASLSRRGAPHQVLERTDSELTIGTTRQGAIHHQRGTKRMPARPPIDPSDAQKRALVKAVQRVVVNEVRRSGFTETEIGEVG
jgi:hypothetical protein